MKTSRTTLNQDRLFPIYRVQLNAYAVIARKLGWNPMSALALIYTEPVTTDEAAVEDAAREGCGDCGTLEKIGGLLGQAQ